MKLSYPKTDPPLIEAYRVYVRGVSGLVWLPGAVCGTTKAAALAVARVLHGPGRYLLTTTDGPILPADWKGAWKGA